MEHNHRTSTWNFFNNDDEEFKVEKIFRETTSFPHAKTLSETLFKMVDGKFIIVERTEWVYEHDFFVKDVISTEYENGVPVKIIPFAKRN